MRVIEVARFHQMLTPRTRQLKKTELNEIPPIVYQLLMLSTKGMRARIIQGIVRVFDSMDEKCHQDDLQER